MPEITVSPKQRTAFDLLSDPYVVELLFGGGAGGGKSWLVCLWAVIECRRYPGIRIGLGRKDISNLRKTTALTLLTEVHPALGVREADYRYSALVDPGVYYNNGSAIVFVDLAPAPSDPNFDRLGSLNLTHNIIEEAGEIVVKARSVFTSRKNRKLNKDYGITGKTILTCNPSPNFVREEFYDPYIKLGAGDHQLWDHGRVEVHGRLETARRAFIRSLPTDNPFLSQNYLETLRQLPETERRRLLEGDWDFDDDDSKLYKVHLLRTVESAEGDVYGGCDPSRGGDGCIFTAKQGKTVIDQQRLEIPKTPNLDIGTFVAERYIEFCDSHGIGYDRAAVDAVGIGASVYDACMRLRFYVQAFNAGSTEGVRVLDRHGQVADDRYHGDGGVPLFNNIRSQNLYDMAQAMHTGELNVIEDLPYLDELKKDMAAHTFEVRERQTVVESKQKLKKRLGRSPDYLDSLQAAWWCEQMGADSRQPSISFI